MCDREKGEMNLLFTSLCPYSMYMYYTKHTIWAQRCKQKIHLPSPLSQTIINRERERECVTEREREREREKSNVNLLFKAVGAGQAGQAMA